MVSDWVVSNQELLIESQRKIIDSLRLACELKDLSISALHSRIKTLEEKIK
jgi:hypothetical protein